MIKGILIFLVVVIVLIILDFLLAGFQPGLKGIPFLLAWFDFAREAKDFRKRVVKVDHDMTAEEFLASTSIERPIFKSSDDDGVRIYNDTYDTVYRVCMTEDSSQLETCKNLLPLPKYTYSSKKPEMKYIRTKLFFWIYRNDEALWVYDYGDIRTDIYRVAKNTEIVCKGIIYNDTDDEVTIEYLGDKDNPTMHQFFTMKPKSAEVVEENSLIRVVSK